jgi:hypothetical protein
MKRQRKLPILEVALSFSLLVIGCSPKSMDLKEDSYQPINLAEVQGELIGDDPEAITLALFGNKEAVEGNFSQEIKVIDESGFKETVILTKMNLPDDSVRGIRYQLQFEFDQSIGKWQLKKAGRQQSCYRSESPTDWTIELCP